LFGSPGQNSPARGFVQVCLSREFRMLTLDSTSPISTWLRQLAAGVEARGRHSGVAVIGMCLTGGIVLATMLAPNVRGVVSSQPATPFTLPFAGLRRRSNLGLDPDDLKKIKATGKPVLALRFKRDVLCPRERLHRIHQEFSNASVIEVPMQGTYSDSNPPIKPWAHAVLTYAFVPKANHPTQDALDKVMNFLHANLRQ
jgi:dienelactone hydrolase